MSMYEGVPPQLQEQFDQFMIAYANAGRLTDAIVQWTKEMPRRPGMAGHEILAPPHGWLRERTGFTDEMLATTLLAVFASGAIRPDPAREEVWLLSGEGELDVEAARDRLLGILDIVTRARSGHHTSSSPQTSVPDTAAGLRKPTDLPMTAPRRPSRRRWPRWLRPRRPGNGTSGT